MRNLEPGSAIHRKPASTGAKAGKTCKAQTPNDAMTKNDCKRQPSNDSVFASNERNQGMQKDKI